MLKNKYYQVKVLLKRFHSNGNPINLICRLQRFHHLIVRLYLSPWKWKVPFVYFSVILKKWCFPHMGSKPIFHHFIVVLGWGLTWSRLKNRSWWILPWKRYPKIRNQDLRRECCSLRTADVSPCSSQLRDVSRNVPRRRWARRNVCLSQAKNVV